MVSEIPCFHWLDSIAQGMFHALMVSLALPFRPTLTMCKGICLRSELGSLLESTHLAPYMERLTMCASQANISGIYFIDPALTLRCKTKGALPANACVKYSKRSSTLFGGGKSAVEQFDAGSITRS
jgi:hypothetical protein